MKKTNILILVAAVVVFAAGALVGMVGQRAVAKTSEAPLAPLPRGRSQLIQDLGLSPAQQEKIRTIWSQAVVKAGPPRPINTALDRERDQAIQALMSDDLKARYLQVVDEYRQKSDTMHQASRAIFADAEEQTKAMLDPAQRTKYEETLKNRPRRSRSSTGPTTRTLAVTTTPKAD